MALQSVVSLTSREEGRKKRELDGRRRVEPVALVRFSRWPWLGGSDVVHEEEAFSRTKMRRRVSEPSVVIGDVSGSGFCPWRCCGPRVAVAGRVESGSWLGVAEASVYGEGDLSLDAANANEMKLEKPLMFLLGLGLGQLLGSFFSMATTSMLFTPYSLFAYKRKLWAWLWAIFCLPPPSFLYSHLHSLSASKEKRIWAWASIHQMAPPIFTVARLPWAWTKIFHAAPLPCTPGIFWVGGKELWAQRASISFSTPVFYLYTPIRIRLGL